MRVALVNPRWRYENSIYFGCREPHLPLELGYAKALLEADGHETILLDGQLQHLPNEVLAEHVAAFRPEMTVVTTAPTYLFWRCAPPELRTPAEFLAELGRRGGTTVAAGPHGSATPGATLRKLGCDVVVRGECEDVVRALAAAGGDAGGVAGTARLERGAPVLEGPPAATAFEDVPPLAWPDGLLRSHDHHHHRFDGGRWGGPGAEVEASRGCPYACTFCAKIDYRDKYRRRKIEHVLAEIDGLVAQGVAYVYFVDEIFLPQRPLLEALAERDVRIGVQTRIDLWSEDMIALLGKAGCVSVEAGVESLSVEGRAALEKRCRMDNDALADRLALARRHIPFVQANLIATPQDDPAVVALWRERLREAGVWANDPVPLFPYPSSPAYRSLFGSPDDEAWERAHAWYLGRFGRFSDIEDERPAALPELEAACRTA